MKTFLGYGVLCLIQFVSSQSECPEDWTRWLDEKCYSLHVSFLSYEAAQQVCATKGGLLATLKEEAQQTFMDNFIHNVSGIEEEVWLGATRFNKTGFQWGDGTFLDYANWAPDSPSEIDGRDCVVMQSRISKLTDPEGRWRDISCNRPNLFVCESESIWGAEEVRKVLVETRKKLENLVQLHERRYQDLVTKHESLDASHKNLDVRHHNLDAKHENLSARHQTLVQNPVPVGFIYTQLPGQPVPSSLWPNIKWKEISSQFAGKFFRVVGGSAAAFETTQNADSPRLTGGKAELFESVQSQDVIISAGSWSPWLYGGRLGTSSTRNHMSFYVSNPEVRPVNTAVRIWIRES